MTHWRHKMLLQAIYPQLLKPKVRLRVKPHYSPSSTKPEQFFPLLRVILARNASRTSEPLHVQCEAAFQEYLKSTMLKILTPRSQLLYLISHSLHHLHRTALSRRAPTLAKKVSPKPTRSVSSRRSKQHAKTL